MGDYAGASLDPASLIAAFEAQLDAKLDETLGPMLESGGVLDPATARAIARQTMLDRFREEIGRLGSSGALTPPPSAHGSEASDGEEEEEEWEEEEWEEEEEQEQEWAEQPAALSLSEYTTGAALAAAMAGADPFSAADVAVEALATLSARPLTPVEQQEADAAPPPARLDEMARLALEAESEANSVRARLNAALQRCGIAPRAEGEQSEERNALLRQRALQAARESAAAAAAELQLHRPQPQGEEREEEVVEEEVEAAAEVAEVESTSFNADAAAAAAAVTAKAAAAAAAHRLRAGGMSVPLPTLAGAQAAPAADDFAQRRVRPGGLMLPPEDGRGTREVRDRRTLETEAELAFEKYALGEADPEIARLPRARKGAPKEKEWSRLC